MAEKTIISEKSTYVDSNAPGTNYGTGTGLVITYSVTYSFYRYALIEFDISQCPSANSIIEALLTVNCSATDNLTTHVSRITGSWVENSVTWNTKPSNAATDYGTLSLNTTGEKSVDITDLVKEWKEGTYDNYGLYLLNPSAGKAATLRSDDYATEAERPRLVITYKPSGGFFAFFCEAWQKHDKIWQPKLAIPKGYTI